MIMPKLNRQLVTSIIVDIKELITVENEICSWIGKVEYLSWRFPTRFAKNLNVMEMIEKHKGSAGEMYILLLEIIYDRMHFVLRLMIEFMNGYPFIKEIFEETTRAKKNDSMSLGNIIKILWWKLKLISETITKNMIKIKQPDDPVFPISRGCQASGSLSHCESCSSASKAIAYLTDIISNALQDNGLSSVIVKEREVIRVELFHKTQWDVMTKLTEATTADIDTLLEMTSMIRSKSKTEAKEYQNSLNSLKAELEKQKMAKISLEIKIEETESRMHAVECELRTLKYRRIELVEKNFTLTKFLFKAEEKSSSLETLLSVTLRQLAETGESKIELENTIRNLQNELTSMKQINLNEVTKLEKNLDDLRDDNNSIKTQHRKEIKDLEKKLSKVLKKLEEKERLLELAEFKLDKKISADETSESPYPEGDPEIDMGQQLASNKATIERLTRQNERLSKTLTRLREHRLNSRIN